MLHVFLLAATSLVLGASAQVSLSHARGEHALETSVAWLHVSAPQVRSGSTVHAYVYVDKAFASSASLPTGAGGTGGDIRVPGLVPGIRQSVCVSVVSQTEDGAATEAGVTGASIELDWGGGDSDMQPTPDACAFREEHFPKKKVMITGCAGFIGSHLADHLLARGDGVVCIDNVAENLYPARVKRKTLSHLLQHPNFSFVEMDYGDMQPENTVGFDSIVHLAAYAGVRNSVKNAASYFENNVVGTTKFMDAIRHGGSNPHFVYASSSSVYGLNEKQPFSEEDCVETPNSPYAASKKAMELLVGVYARLHKMMAIGLRFFTVYGPRGRPDMAPYIFLRAIALNLPLPLVGQLEHTRDYTYVTDIVKGILGALDYSVQPGTHRVYNLGNSRPIKLGDFIAACEEVAGSKAQIEIKPGLKGDVPHTYANTSRAQHDFGYNPELTVKEGLARALVWMSANVEEFANVTVSPA